MSTLRALTGQTLLLLGNYGGNILIGLLATVIVTRALGPELRGAYAWLLTVHVVAVQLATLVPYNTARQLGITQTQSRWPGLAGTFTATSMVGSLLTLPLFIWAWFQPLGQQYPWFVALGWLAVPVASLASSLSGLVHLRHTFADVVLPTLISRFSSTALVAALWLAGLLTLGTALWMALFTATLGLITFLWRLDIPLRTWRWRGIGARKLAGFVGATWLATLVGYAMPKIPLLWLPHYAPMATVGHFGVAGTLLDVALIIPFAASSVLIDHFSKQQGQGGTSQKARHRALFALTALVAVLAVGGYVLAPFVIPLLFGADFAPATGYFHILLLALLIQGPLTLYTSQLTARAHGQALLWPTIAGFSATALAAWVLMPPHGATGAAWAAVAGYAVQLLTTLLFWRKSRANGSGK